MIPDTSSFLEKMWDCDFWGVDAPCLSEISEESFFFFF